MANTTIRSVGNCRPALREPTKTRPLRPPAYTTDIPRSYRYTPPPNYFGPDEIYVKVYRNPDFYLVTNATLGNDKGSVMALERAQFIERNAKILKIPVRGWGWEVRTTMGRG